MDSDGDCFGRSRTPRVCPFSIACSGREKATGVSDVLGSSNETDAGTWLDENASVASERQTERKDREIATTPESVEVVPVPLDDRPLSV